LAEATTYKATETGCCSVGARRDGEAASLPVIPMTVSPAVRPARRVRLPGGRVRVGDDAGALPQDGESSARLVNVKTFAIDPYAVTNAWFGEFVAATRYRTDAERFGWSLVFAGFVAHAPAPPHDPVSWWRRVDGASWRAPEGPGSTVAERQDHPVVHVSWNDAAAFAAWAGGRLPSEAEWEQAARGGLAEARFPWGEREPDDTSYLPCNIWQGTFPKLNTAADGYAGTAPVASFAPNRAGLYNMVGNTWEWCADAFRVRSLSRAGRQRDAAARAAGERVLKGGSYLCHRSYCYRYRIAARTGVSADGSTGHVGFRLAFND
jgi:formylglycine-generating enzyme